MAFSKYAPGKITSAFIENYWIVENEDSTPRVEKIIPDGFTEIIFHYGDPYRIELNGPWQLQPRQLLAGQLRKYFFLQNTGISGILGIKFKPAALTALFGLSMSDYTDKVVHLPAALGHRLQEVETIACAPLPAGIKVAQIDEWLAKHTAADPNDEIEKAVALIADKNGGVTVAEIGRQLFITERRLERLFKKYIGLPPKFYARVIRFNYIFSLIQQQQLTWTDLAFESGYYDSAHFVKNFKAFTGEDPSSYVFEDENLANFFLLKKPF